MSSSRLRRVVATSTLSVALVAGGVVAPTAGAVTTSIKNDKCTITLSEKESNDLSNAESKDNDVDSSLLKDDYEILPKDAGARARAVQNQSDELYRDLADFEAEVELGDEDAVKRAKNNIKVAETFRDIAPEYIKALNACAKKEEFNKKKDSDRDNTSSNIDKGGAILLGVSGALTIILMALRAAGPFLKTVLPPQLADMIPA
ncbi:hypothetical protein [Corynebacterium minutissimum]|uniref:Putative secreted protein n=1 Tax=Corynebacterium minutissimum TaxID=38301 RepID=A0A2X4RW32_9CORY|nr:hypothetical protein [Corynebacterium minutissimum]KHO30111.1 hypothetical protein NX84_04600 [Corynebacterium minutissimum]QPS60599.1 hypothetical protein I6G51_05270 [Corynebacterium minutissimum]QQA78613.1 hypothetical protein I6H49_07585 [Corynebacterium minutissimum]SQI00530.1 putative secreted protein [Corynebacterium minutissimum]VEG05402.1 putative secreted protein [Corynebacterium minutissimum]